AMGVNVSYAPSCDLASNPTNPHLGIRAFGDDPAEVATFAAAMTRGLRSSGVAVAIKHFPGLGEADLDSHLGLPVIEHDRARLAALRARLATAPRPGLEVVGSADHLALAREVAERSIALVRDRDGLLPLRLAPGDRLLAVMPAPRELTPADTSASVAPGLAAA